MQVRYQNCPIIEVVIEFRLPSDTNWDQTVAGDVHRELHDMFPRKETRKQHALSVSFQSEQIQQEVQTTERLMFLNSEGNRLIQIEKNFLALNILKPYPKWENVRPQFEKIYKVLNEYVTFDRIEFAQLQYVNRIEIPGVLSNLDKFFAIRPEFSSPLGQKVTNFMLASQVSMNNDRDNCGIILAGPGTILSGGDTAMLDLRYYLAQLGTVKQENFLDWLDNAHKQLSELFEQSITPQLREHFQSATVNI